MAAIRQEKDRPSMGVDEPVTTKNYVAGESFGISESTEEPPQAPLTEVQKQWQLVHDAYHRGYSQGLIEGLAQGPNHPAVQQSVANFFGDWQGAEAARQRSTQRFRNWYRKERDAA
jgi:hypothetical protein